MDRYLLKPDPTNPNLTDRVAGSDHRGTPGQLDRVMSADRKPYADYYTAGRTDRLGILPHSHGLAAHRDRRDCDGAEVR